MAVVEDDDPPGQPPERDPDTGKLICLECRRKTERIQWMVDEAKVAQQNFAAEIDSLRRKLSRTESDLRKAREEGIEEGVVDRLIAVWKETHKRALVTPHKDRHKAVLWAAKHYSEQECADAIIGNRKYPWQRYKEWLPEPVDDKCVKRDDLTDIFKNEANVETFVEKAKRDPDVDAFQAKLSRALDAARREKAREPRHGTLDLDRTPVDAYLAALDRLAARGDGTGPAWTLRWAPDRSRHWWEARCPLGDHGLVLSEATPGGKVNLMCAGDCDPRDVRKRLGQVNQAWNEWVAATLERHWLDDIIGVKLEAPTPA